MSAALELLDDAAGMAEAALVQLSEDELAGLMVALGEVSSRVSRLRVVTTGEAVSRGTPHAQGLGVVDWVAGSDAALPRAEARAVATVATACHGRAGGVAGPLVPAEVGESGSVAAGWAGLWGRVTAGVLPVRRAAQIVGLHTECTAYADPVALAQTRDLLVEHAHEWSDGEMRRVLAHARVTMRPAAELERDEQSMRAARGLWFTQRSGSPLWDVRGVLDPEGAAVLRAAVEPLSAPRPVDDGNGRTIRDTRLPATRRADALIEVLTRAGAISPRHAGGPSTQLVLTMSLDALTGATNGGGHAGDEVTLSPGAVRRRACDAGIIPVLLDSRSQVLDVGYEARCFTPAQRLVLRRKYPTCSMPGCSIPSQWCDIHHLIEWQHAGRTDLGNGAPLCGYHHTLVHERGITHHLDPDTGTVRWHP